MSSQVYEFDAREGGAFHISLTYATPRAIRKSGVHNDTCHGHFVKLVSNEQVVDEFEFKTADPVFGGTL